MNRPIITVLMMTYNHEQYIEQAVESALAQNFDLGYEILIGDDGSTDNTLSLLHELSKRYANIRVLSTDKNLGIIPNFLRLIEASRGKYIALLEGDDYWVDPNKLMDQWKMLEADSSLALSVGRTQNRIFWGEKKDRYYLPELLSCYLFHTSTFFFRKRDTPSFEGLDFMQALDSLLVSFLLEKGDCGFIDRELSYYRRHSQGTWTGSEVSNQIIETHKITNLLSKHFNGKFDTELHHREIWIYTMMVKIATSKPFYPQYKRNLLIAKVVVTRNLSFIPVKSILFIIDTVFPIRSLFNFVRFRLKIGTRIKGLFPNTAGYPDGKK